MFVIILTDVDSLCITMFTKCLFTKKYVSIYPQLIYVPHMLMKKEEKQVC